MLISVIGMVVVIVVNAVVGIEVIIVVGVFIVEDIQIELYTFILAPIPVYIKAHIPYVPYILRHTFRSPSSRLLSSFQNRGF